MEQTKMKSRVEDDKVIVLERVFNAPRELVFRMFKECEHLKHWWGPRGWDLPVCTMDFRPGGVWHYCMKCVDPAQGEYYGMESWGKAVYREISEPERLVYVDYFSDAEGNVNEGMPSTEITNVYTELDGKTQLVSRAVYATAEEAQKVLDMGALEGIAQTWDRLEEHLEAIQ